MASFESVHDPRFDNIVADARQFTVDVLGLTVADTSQIAVVSEENVESVKREFRVSHSGGAYDRATGRILAFENTYSGMPNTTHLHLKSKIVHELGHSATEDTQEATFYEEAYAGIAEYEFLTAIRASGQMKPASDFVLKKAGLHPDQSIAVPGEYRYLDKSEESADLSGYNPKASYTASGLVAALGLSYGQRLSGISNTDILEAGQSNIGEAVLLMRLSLNALKPHMWKYYKTLPETNDGLVTGTFLIQEEARKQGLIPKL